MSADEPSSRGAALVLIALMLGSGGAVLLIAVTPVDEGSSEDENRPVKGASEAVPGHVKALVTPWSGHWQSIPVGHLAGST